MIYNTILHTDILTFTICRETLGSTSMCMFPEFHQIFLIVLIVLYYTNIKVEIKVIIIIILHDGIFVKPVFSDGGMTATLTTKDIQNFNTATVSSTIVKNMFSNNLAFSKLNLSLSWIFKKTINCFDNGGRPFFLRTENYINMKQCFSTGVQRN